MKRDLEDITMYYTPYILIEVSLLLARIEFVDSIFIKCTFFTNGFFLFFFNALTASSQYGQLSELKTTISLDAMILRISPAESEKFCLLKEIPIVGNEVHATRLRKEIGIIDISRKKLIYE